MKTNKTPNSLQTKRNIAASTESFLDYKEILAQSVQYIDYKQLFADVSESPEDFSVVFKLMFDENEKVAWHAAWICEKVSERSPHFFSEKAIEQIVTLAISTAFTGLQRLLLSMVLNLGLPNEIPVDFINLSFERMISPKSPVAVQVLSMKILYEFTKHEPDLKAELKVYLESIDVENYTTGYKSARKNILKKLQKEMRQRIE